jgi:hypothetical protein
MERDVISAGFSSSCAAARRATVRCGEYRATPAPNLAEDRKCAFHFASDFFDPGRKMALRASSVRKPVQHPNRVLALTFCAVFLLVAALFAGHQPVAAPPDSPAAGWKAAAASWPRATT